MSPAIDRYRGRWVAQAVASDGTVVQERVCHGPFEATDHAIMMASGRQLSFWERLGAMWRIETWHDLGGIGTPPHLVGARP